jgi:hypothetical protein
VGKSVRSCSSALIGFVEGACGCRDGFVISCLVSGQRSVIKHRCGEWSAAVDRKSSNTSVKSPVNKKVLAAMRLRLTNLQIFTRVSFYCVVLQSTSLARTEPERPRPMLHSNRFRCALPFNNGNGILLLSMADSRRSFRKLLVKMEASIPRKRELSKAPGKNGGEYSAYAGLVCRAGVNTSAQT